MARSGPYVDQLVKSGSYPIFTKIVMEARQPHLSRDEQFRYGLRPRPRLHRHGPPAGGPGLRGRGSEPAWRRHGFSGAGLTGKCASLMCVAVMVPIKTLCAPVRWIYRRVSVFRLFRMGSSRRHEIHEV
ncbi:hypothetical protein GCM10020220_009160 [Nonomuraea rubra]